ncbi:MAG: PQQ-dependent sugar dehydrogenase [bacterium]|nr:PQQ-dependent sugar dehydrogenase [bacterium]
MMRRTVILIVAIAAVMALAWAAGFYRDHLRGVGPAVGEPPRDIAEVINTTGMPLTLPDGFSMTIFARDLGDPRAMIKDPSDTLLVSIPAQGRVAALPDRNGDGAADEVVPVIWALDRPHGLALRCMKTEGVPSGQCTLYVAETGRVAAYDYDQGNMKAANKRTIMELPSDGGHFTRSLLLLPPPNDHKLLVAVGSSCNVCEEGDLRRAKILIVDLNGAAGETFASGLRNAVFMAVAPQTGKVWATEMGRDLLGDDTPPDEINIIEQGRHYGWPICYGRNIQDTAFHPNDHAHTRAHCALPFEVPSHIDIPAHSAPLGLAFVPSEGWPEAWRGDLLVAFHGSWNRSVPTGYKIVRYDLDEQGNVLGVSDVISGWLTAQGALGRPVDILVEPHGIMYISDDKAGVVYRVTYTLP